MLCHHELNPGECDSPPIHNVTAASGTFEQIDSLLHFLGELENQPKNADTQSHRLVVNQLLETARAYLESLLEEDRYSRLAEESKDKTRRLLVQLQGLIDLLNRHQSLETHCETNGCNEDKSNNLGELLHGLANWSRKIGEPLQKDPCTGSTPSQDSDEQKPKTQQTIPPTITEGIEQLPSVIVKAFGSFSVTVNDHLVTEFPNSKGKQLLKYLLINRRKICLKEELMELLWPRYDTVSARNNLNVVVYGLRQAAKRYLGKHSLILFREGGYLINPEIQIFADFEQFDLQYQQALKVLSSNQPKEAIENLKEAQALYTDTFLEEDLYCDWVNDIRENYRRMYLQVLESLDSAYEGLDNNKKRIEINQKILEQDSCNERAHEHLMNCYESSGQRHLALRQYQEAKLSLKQELELPPSKKLNNLYNRIKQST